MIDLKENETSIQQLDFSGLFNALNKSYSKDSFNKSNLDEIYLREAKKIYGENIETEFKNFKQIFSNIEKKLELNFYKSSKIRKRGLSENVDQFSNEFLKEVKISEAEKKYILDFNHETSILTEEYLKEVEKKVEIIDGKKVVKAENFNLNKTTNIIESKIKELKQKISKDKSLSFDEKIRISKFAATMNDNLKSISNHNNEKFGLINKNGKKFGFWSALKNIFQSVVGVVVVVIVVALFVMIPIVAFLALPEIIAAGLVGLAAGAHFAYTINCDIFTGSLMTESPESCEECANYFSSSAPGLHCATCVNNFPGYSFSCN